MEQQERERGEGVSKAALAREKGEERGLGDRTRRERYGERERKTRRQMKRET